MNGNIFELFAGGLDKNDLSGLKKRTKQTNKKSRQHDKLIIIHFVAFGNKTKIKLAS